MREAVNDIVVAISAEKSAAKRDVLKGKLLKVVGAATYEAVLGPLTAAQKASLGGSDAALQEAEVRQDAVGSRAAAGNGEEESSTEEEEEEASSSDGDSDGGSGGEEGGESLEGSSEDELVEVEARHAARQVRTKTARRFVAHAAWIALCICSACTKAMCVHACQTNFDFGG